MAKKPYPFSVCEQCCPESGGSGGNGEPITIDTEMSDTSENAVQNKVIKKYVDDNAKFLYVYVAINEDGTVTADKDIFELLEAHRAGRCIIVYSVADVYSVCTVMDADYGGEMYFSRIASDFREQRLSMLYCSESGWSAKEEEFATKEDIGDIETALDSIIAIQNKLIGGETV